MSRDTLKCVNCGRGYSGPFTPRTCYCGGRLIETEGV